MTDKTIETTLFAAWTTSEAWDLLDREGITIPEPCTLQQVGNGDGPARVVLSSFNAGA